MVKDAGRACSRGRPPASHKSSEREREIERGGKYGGNIRGYKEVVSEGEVERE